MTVRKIDAELSIVTEEPEYAARFWVKVEPRTDGCWLWTGSKASNGYGNFNIGKGKVASAHRTAYELLVGPIPAGLEIDHLCRNRACVNPTHMEPVTRIVNARRGDRAGIRATHCPAGHPYDEENTIVRTNRGRLQRICRECLRIRRQEKKSA